MKTTYVDLQGAGLVGSVSTSNFTSKDVYTHAQRTALDVSKVGAGEVYICEQTDSVGTQDKGIYAYSGTNALWYKVGGQEKVMQFVNANPITTAPTLDDNTELVVWAETGTNSNVRYNLYLNQAGTIRATAQEPKAITVAGITPDTAQKNTFQKLNNRNVFVDWDGNVVEFSLADDKSEFIVSPFTATAGVPFPINVLTITGYAMVDSGAHNINAEDSTGLEVTVVEQSSTVNIFNILVDADITGGKVFVNTKLNF